MSVGASQPSGLRFGVFELDLAAGQLRKAGLLIKLSPQPFKVLAMIAGRGGEVVTREEIQREIWGSETFVDFEHGVNHCIKQIRKALRDSADTPRYVETLPRRGYRFISPVEEFTKSPSRAGGISEGSDVAALADKPAGLLQLWRRHPRITAAGLSGFALAALAMAVWVVYQGRSYRSIAVLPFEDMSPEKNQEYLSEGLSGELRSELARIAELRVTGTTSSVQFKGKLADAHSIGRKLNVAVLLEGSVRKQGNRARISVQLVKTADGFQLWSESYERDMSDILAMQDEISSAVIAALKLRLLAGKAAPSWKRANVEAYDAYLQGRYFYGRRNKSELQKAIAYFEQAIKLDPRYAPAWAELARCRAGQADRGYVPEREGYRQAQQAVDRALALDKNLADAYAVLGLIRNHDWDWTGADAAYRRAFQLAPGDATIIGGVADSAWTLGRMDDAISLYRRATEIEPQDNNLYHNLGLVLDSAGRWEEATQALTRALELAPEMEGPHFTLCRIYLAQSRAQDALAEAGKEKHPVFRLLGSTLAYYALGRRTESDANLADLIAKFGTDDPYQIADAYAGRGETDQAFEWLDRAWSLRDSGLVEAKVDPLLSSLKKDPRYAALLTKMRLPL